MYIYKVVDMCRNGDAGDAYGLRVLRFGGLR